MKITKRYCKSEGKDIIEVDSATYAGAFKLDIGFSDGSHRLVGFQPFPTKAVHPSISNISTNPFFRNLILSMATLTGMITT